MHEIMKIIVPIKRVVDPYVSVQVKNDESGVNTDGVKMSMNPFDEIAVEEAVRLQEAGVASEIVAVTIADASSDETLRSALAIGADRAIRIEHNEELQPLSIAKVLKAVTENEHAGLVLMGKQAIDNDNNQTGQMLSALLGWSQGTFISEQEIKGDSVQVTREIDNGLETLSLTLPAVLTTDLRLNEPRYIKLPNMMKAKKKPLEVQTMADFGVEDEALAAKFTVQKVQEPPTRQAGVMVNSVSELISKLRDEAKVL